jgi:hypothetical protein
MTTTSQETDRQPSRLATLFVDELEDDGARLLLDEHSFTVPRALLPADVQEGQWLLFSIVKTAAPPDETSARRKRLGEDDPGGKVEL